MKKKFRIKRNKDFQTIFTNGKSFANRQFVVYVLSNKPIGHYRVGLSVSKKLGNAVKRNQIKRYIRQVFLELKNDVKTDVDYIVIARKPVADMNYHEVKKSLVHVLKVARILDKEFSL